MKKDLSRRVQREYDKLVFRYDPDNFREYLIKCDFPEELADIYLRKYKNILKDIDRLVRVKSHKQ